ncbi:C2H2 type zinc-finger-domain-containing protein [Phyllosticta citrichinensis]
MASNQSSHPFTCNTCQVAFRASELQRAHMQTDWHRYNLKRRVASLPPLSSEIFAEKVLANKASAAATAARAQYEKSCDACQKTYFSENAYANHLNSQKHRQNVARASRRDDDAASVMSSTFSLGETVDSTSTALPDRDTDSEVSEVVDGIQNASLGEGSSEDVEQASRTATVTVDATSAKIEPPTEVVDCLFCNFRSPTRDLNLGHMQRFHGLFIPEQEYLDDLSGLLRFLWRKIHEYCQCLYCNKIVYTATGIQTHMRDRGHCKIAYEDEDQMLEIGEYYDFTRTYSDDEEGSVTEGEDGWETDSSVSDVPTDEITSVPIDDRSHRHAHTGPRAVYHDEYEMHLPTGRTAGHRSLRHYFRQNLRNYPSAAERAERLAIEEAQAMRNASSSDEDDDDDEAEGGVQLEPGQSQLERGRGRNRDRQVVSRPERGLAGVTDIKKREVRAAERRENRKAQREQARAEWTKNKKGNFQKHFRDPLLQ